MSRTVNVVRMQLVNRQTYIWVPLMVLGAAFVLSLAIWAMIRGVGAEGDLYGGGSQAPLWYFGVVGVQALTLTFPFSQAMSVTRREFFVGTLLTAGLASALLAIVFVVGGLIEQATAGWGMNGYFFYLPPMWEAGALGAGLAFFAIALGFFTVGFAIATVYKRFGMVALTSTIIGLCALLVLGLFALIRFDLWDAMFGWFATQGAIGLSLWGLVVVAVVAALSFLTLRRATP